MRREEGPYDSRFYDAQVLGSLRSANTVLGLLFDLYRPRSVVDVGCGRGAWLAAAGALGAETLTGYDGDWVQTPHLVSDQIDFRSVNLEEVASLEDRYDLAISVEVAEHLSERRGRPFIALLCRASDVIVFGAAIKHQGGARHLNEQFQSYWIGIFEDQDFECFDIFRPRIWDNDDVEWWYRQNTFLFVKRTAAPAPVSRELLRRLERPIADVVHPRNYERCAAPPPTQ